MNYKIPPFDLTKPGPEGWKQECGSVACYLKKQHPSHGKRITDFAGITDKTPIGLTGWAYRKALLNDLRQVFRNTGLIYRWQRERKNRFNSAWYIVKRTFGHLRYLFRMAVTHE